ncbi:Epoxyqueuosine reductase [Sporomusa silvacetica DSM 10669]|uniref:Epoxyqueuosine reductase n=1 Tax=Sporomusa silvacetica DSM 10669 TaxID=1123289 RepID=A0ABZ3IS37_9FIRM|nr:4Fe-4S binding protein [Sporomusa silvacetica]OZC20700.1 epoxyqueuosine reductase [Sporomusa silvacetica DSM 10669]
MEETIRKYVLDLGVDDIGFLSVQDYKSPASPAIDSIFPEARSIIILAYHELATCESPSPITAMNGRMDLMEFSRSCNYKLARFLTKDFCAKAMTVPFSYPMDLGNSIAGQLSLRHAAVSAGLGTFGRHNIVVHPQFGTRVCFTAVLTDLELKTTNSTLEDICVNCNQCVTNCPANALDQPGQTDVLRCLQKSQPYGIVASAGFWVKFVNSSADEQNVMLRSEFYAKMYQSQFIGFQYYCFNCMKTCPVGR